MVIIYPYVVCRYVRYHILVVPAFIDKRCAQPESIKFEYSRLLQEPEVYLHKSRTHPEVTVLLDKGRSLIKATMTQPNGNSVDLLPVGHERLFVEVDADGDIDQALLEQFEIVRVLAGPLGLHEVICLSHLSFLLQGDMKGEARRSRGISKERRLLEVSPPNPECDVIAKASLYIAADSDFVADANAECDFCALENGNKAAAAIQAIFDATRQVYLRDACVDLSLKGYDIRTDPSNDPYRDIKIGSVGICTDSNSLLPKFTTWMITPGNNPSNGDRTLFHLFYGLPDASGGHTIGCAWYNGQ